MNKEKTKKQSRDTGTLTLLSPLRGRVIELKSVNDPTFSEELLGYGCAIIPCTGLLSSPSDGIISSIPDTKHAIVLTTDDGVEILMHIGIDTVELGGRHFRAFVSTGDRVHAGDPLVEFDLEAIKKDGYDLSTPVIITNSESFCDIRPLVSEAEEKTPLLSLSPAKN